MPRDLADIPNTATLTNDTGYPVVVYSHGIGHIPAGETETINLGALEGGRAVQSIRGETLKERVWQAIVGLVESGIATLVSTVPVTAIGPADLAPIYPHDGERVHDIDIPRPGLPNYHVDPAGPMVLDLDVGGGNAYLDVTFTKGVYGPAAGCPGTPDEATIELAAQPTVEVYSPSTGDITLSAQPTPQAHVASAGDILLSDQPAEGDAFSINDGTTTVTFAFDGGTYAGADTPIVIGTDVAATRVNMLAAIESAGLNLLSATAAATGVDVTIEFGTVGAEILVVTNVSTFLSVTDFAGGSFTEGDGFTINDGDGNTIIFAYTTPGAFFSGTATPIDVGAGGVLETAMNTETAVSAALTTAGSAAVVSRTNLVIDVVIPQAQEAAASLVRDLNDGGGIAVTDFAGGSHTVGDNFTITPVVGAPITFVFVALGETTAFAGTPIAIGADAPTTAERIQTVLLANAATLGLTDVILTPLVDGVTITAPYGSQGIGLGQGADITVVDFDNGSEDGAPGLLNPNCFALTLVQGAGGTITGIRITSVKDDDNVVEADASDLIGGETVVRLFLDIDGVVIGDGSETVSVFPVSGAIVDANGVVAPAAIGLTAALV